MRSVRGREIDQAMPKASWLCRDNFDRKRLLDMEARVRPIRQRTFVILAVAILILTPQLGWWPLAAMIPMVAFYATTNGLLDTIRRPEYLMFGAWIGGELTIAAAVALEGGPRVAALSWLAMPVVTLSSRFSGRGVVVGVAITIGLVLAVAFGVDPQAVLASPQLVVAPVALVLSVAVLSTPLMYSDIEHRNDAVLDELTGMLNRKALLARVQELTEQSVISGEPVGVIAADLDHFKLVNDTRGHAVGDLVLRDVSHLLRKQLRAFDLAYRLGGEEFLILVPGVRPPADGGAGRAPARGGRRRAGGGRCAGDDELRRRRLRALEAI